MSNFSKEKANQILKNEIDIKTLILQYPELEQKVMEDISKYTKEKQLEEKDLIEFIDKNKRKAIYAMDQIKKSNQNKVTMDTFLPEIIKARIAINLIDQLYLLKKSDKPFETVRFNLWDGTILQKLLFKKDFERKQSSIFWFRFFWPLITNRKILMPLVSEKGIYCFYSKKLIKELAGLIGDSKCIEIGAGDGTLTKFLKSEGANCIATDDYSWKHYINYPDFVEQLAAKDALDKYKPETVICSWTPPGNEFEKNIFRSDTVKLYIVIGSKNPSFSGNEETYQTQQQFTMEHSKRLSKLLLPQSDENAVFLFKRKPELPGLR